MSTKMIYANRGDEGGKNEKNKHAEVGPIILRRNKRALFGGVNDAMTRMGHISSWGTR